MRRNTDATLRELERDYVSSRTLDGALRVALARRRAGQSGASDALAALLSDAAALGAVARENVRVASRRELRPVPAPTASFVTEMTRFMFSELLVRPRFAVPPFDLRRSVVAPTVSDGVMAWSTGVGGVTVTSDCDGDIDVRDVASAQGYLHSQVDPSWMAVSAGLRMRPFIFVVRDIERLAITVGVRFSPVLPRQPSGVWESLSDQYNEAADRAGAAFPDPTPAHYEALNDRLARDAARIYVDWARTEASDRVVIHEADATAFAMETPT